MEAHLPEGSIRAGLLWLVCCRRLDWGLRSGLCVSGVPRSQHPPDQGAV